MAYIDIKNLTKIYERFKQQPVVAVSNLDLTIKRGEIIALLGPSGCGKTSMLRMLAGFEVITDGTFTLNGKRRNDDEPKDRNIAMAFEGYALYPTLTVRENIRFSLRRKRAGKDIEDSEKKLAEIIEILELAPILNQYPSSLSSGEQQKTSLARAFIKNSDLCLLDEPLSQLESSVRIKLRARIKEFLSRYRMTCVIVTHNQSDAIALADRVAVMNEGQLMQYGSIEELKKKPSNLFVAGFIGQPPMNLLPAHAEYKNSTLELKLLNAQKKYVWTLRKKCRLKDNIRKKLSNNEVVMGILPHRIELTQFKKKSSLTTQATILSNQWMGDQSDVMLAINDIQLVALRYDPLPAKVGDKVTLAISNEELHLFAKDGGEAIVHALV